MLTPRKLAKRCIAKILGLRSPLKIMDKCASVTPMPRAIIRILGNTLPSGSVKLTAAYSPVAARAIWGALLRVVTVLAAITCVVVALAVFEFLLVAVAFAASVFLGGTSTPYTTIH